MAGTGKSTIARSVARSFQNDGILGASFFFKRGDGDRGSASKLFSTIVKQLASLIPEMIDGVQHALEHDPAIAGKSLRLQFDKLILQPLRHVGRDHTATAAVIVIDALDECDRDDDVELILELLPKVDQATNIKIRFFLTSRPESPIRFGLDQINHTSFQNTILQNLDNDVIEHDITIYLKDEFSKIRKKRHRDLSPDWPGEDRIKALARMAVPLFILAVTVCRFVADKRFNPEKRLQQFSQDTPGSKMDKTYRPILNQLLVEDEDDMETLIGEFQEIIGVIICLAAPLPLGSLAELLEMSESDISNHLNFFHSVLSISTDQEIPIRTLDLSFRDYLVHGHKKSQGSTSRFLVDEKQKHELIARKCLSIMKCRLKKNICGLSSYGTLRTEIDQGSIARLMSPSLQYACHYWVYHLVLSPSSKIIDVGFSFLEKHFLHWTESMVILGLMFEVINAIDTLIQVSKNTVNEKNWSLLGDAQRFLRNFASIVDKAPLQLDSYGRLPASGFADKSINLWDPTNGSLVRTIVAGFDKDSQITSIAFSPDFQLIASGFLDCNISLWDPANGELRRTLKGHKTVVISLAFSPDGRLLASLSADKDLKLWDTNSGMLSHTRIGQTDSVRCIVFLSDRQCQILATGSRDCKIKLWDSITGQLKHTLVGHDNMVVSIAFSIDGQGQLLASGSRDSTIRLWNPITGEQKHTLKGHPASVTTVAFSPIGHRLLSGSEDGTIRLWNTTNGHLTHTIGHSIVPIASVAISPQKHPLILASGHLNGTIRLWDPTARDLAEIPDTDLTKVVRVGFSPDGRLVASGSRDCTVKLWNVATGDLSHSFKGHTSWIRSVTFSPCDHSQLLASGSDDYTVNIWDPITHCLQRTLKGHTGYFLSVAYSPDSRSPLLASDSGDCSVKLWDPITGDLRHTLDGHLEPVVAIDFSLGTQHPLLASGSADYTIKLWDPVTGMLKHTVDSKATYPRKSGIKVYDMAVDKRDDLTGSSIPDNEKDVGLDIIERWVWTLSSGGFVLMVKGNYGSLRNINPTALQ
ncbi:hypothetical protein N7493_005849 [Penicillium malachiteum]|uniref:Mitochondrial division protein 1 n=1 Tax=Penicillium malachiteum TaxID=1324776 RepID=A0AAD6MVZ7_9EURO|nr:hypothetical protein N7493_005849 [Penicillium malachiteum]